MSNKDEEVMEHDGDAGPPVLLECVSRSVTPGSDGTEAPEVDPENALRSPPKLSPAVVVSKRKSDESNKTPSKPLTGSMKNTPASLSIIDGPSSSVGKSIRSTRSSIDPSFAAKQRSFLNKVHSALSVWTDDTSSCESDQEVAADEDEALDDKSPEYIPGLVGIPRRILLNGNNKRRREDSPLSKGKIVCGTIQDSTGNNITNITLNEEVEPSPKKKVPPTPINGKIRDIFCWICHREDAELGCASCPRAYHSRCLRRQSNVEVEWVCPECLTILKAENQETRSKALKMLTLDQLCKLLLFAVDRMKSCSGADIFEYHVNVDKFPSYKDYIVNPMCLSLLEKNIKRKMYGSTEAFFADASWIVHNCVIFNSCNSKLSYIAKSILRVCRHEMAEIENCPDCYNYAYTEDENWFIQVCQKPHILVWAKLKGFPFWPAKTVRANADALDVRFFGAHDRAWVPARDCYLYSQENPNPNAPSKVPSTNPQLKKRNPRNNLDSCIEEVELHIKLLKQRFSTFQYAAIKAPVNLKKLDDHLKFMLPDYVLPQHMATTPTTKYPLTKRCSFDLKSSNSSGPSIKRMKADSSSPQPINIMHLFKNSSAAKENGGLKESVSLIKGSSEPAVSKDSAKDSGSACKANGTPVVKENGKASQAGKSLPSKRMSNSTPVTLHTVTPGQSNTFITPLSSPDAASIAELRLKKKDARKIGLIDRLQEKLGLLVNSPLEGLAPNMTEKNESNQCTEQQMQGVKKVLNTNEPRCDPVSLAGVPREASCEDEGKPANNDLENVKRDLFAGARPVSKDSVSQLLQSFNISETLPKVILKKLDLKSDEISGASDVKISPIKTESVSTDEEEEEYNSPANKSPKADNIQKITVSAMEFIPDDSQDAKFAEDSVSKLKTMPVTKPESLPRPSSTEPADPVTSTTSPTAVISPPVKVAVSKSCVQSGGPKPSSSGTEAKSAMEFVAKTLIKPAPKSKLVAASNVKPGGVISTAVMCTTPSKEPAEPTVPPKEEPSSDTESDLHSGADLSFESETEPGPLSGPKSANIVANKVANSKIISSNIPLKFNQINAPKSPQPKLKIVTKSFAIRAKSLSELRDNEVKKPSTPKPTSSKQTNLTVTEDSSVSSTLAAENESSSKKDTEVALKSLLSKNVTIRLEALSSNEKRAVITEPEKLIILSSSSDSNVQHTVSLGVPCAKGATFMVQSGNTIKNIESLPRSVPSSNATTSPTHRLMHGATSVLKVRNIPPSDGGAPVVVDSEEQAVQVMAPKILTLASNASKTLNTSSISSLSSSVAKTATFVAVSQAPTGIPVVRRILPKAIALTSGTSIQRNAKPGSPTAEAICTPLSTTPSIDSSTKVLSSRINVRPLVTTVSTSASSVSPKVTVSQDNVFKMPPRITVGPTSEVDGVPKVVRASSASRREMPPLSIASVCSLRPVSTIQASAGSSALRTSSLSQVHISTSESPSKVFVGKGPVSSELKSQANKMTEVFMGCLKDCLSEMGSMGSLEAQIRCLQLDMEHMHWRHKQEMEELRHNTELVISEIRDRMKVESQRAVNIALANALKEKETAVASTKEKQWCAFCKKEAMFYCCWNTSYCDHQCQQNHWPVHSLTCTQNSSSLVEHDPLPTVENGPAQPASIGRIFISGKEVLSPPLLKKR